MATVEKTEQVKMDHEFHLRPIEKMIEDRKRKVQEMSASNADCSMRIITFVLELQVAMGAQRKTIDGLSSNTVEHHMESISVKRQETHTKKDKRFWEYTSAFLSVISGITGLTGAGVGVYGINQGIDSLTKISKQISGASQAVNSFSGGAGTYAKTKEGRDQGTLGILDQDGQRSRMLADALIQSKGQSERQNDTLYNALIQYLKNQNELKTQLARMVN